MFDKLTDRALALLEIETLQSVLDDHDYDAVRAIRAIFGDDIPRVIQGVRP